MFYMLENKMKKKNTLDKKFKKNLKLNTYSNIDCQDAGF